MEKEVIQGWLTPLLPEHLKDIPNAEIAPMGLANQAGINEMGEFVFKDRVTYDMSFPGAVSETPINGRVTDEELAPLLYGFMFSRLIQYIVECTEQSPNGSRGVVSHASQNISFFSKLRPSFLVLHSRMNCRVANIFNASVYKILNR